MCARARNGEFAPTPSPPVSLAHYYLVVAIFSVSLRFSCSTHSFGASTLMMPLSGSSKSNRTRIVVTTKKPTPNWISVRTRMLSMWNRWNESTTSTEIVRYSTRMLVGSRLGASSINALISCFATASATSFHSSSALVKNHAEKSTQPTKRLRA